MNGQTKTPDADILLRIYPAHEVFVGNPRFNEDSLSVIVNCEVPTAIRYTNRPVPYVTAENYVRIFSQASYILAHHILANRLCSINVSSEEFLEAMENYELYYRNLAMTFHQRVNKGEAFDMELLLKNFKEIRRLNDFVLFTFSNTRTVIQGEMSFIYKN